ncbi:MAG: hypothetical protein ACOY95_03305 [Pseudomonadota bacterium]|jgi:hypothetical protein
MSPILAQILAYCAIVVLAAVAIFYACRAFDRWFDDMFPPSPEEVSRIQAQRVAKQATKDFRRAQRRKRIRAFFRALLSPFNFLRS